MNDSLLTRIAIDVGTPCYVYDSAAILDALNQWQTPSLRRNRLICYAVKANSNLAVLNLLARSGSGFDIVSEGELIRVIRAGGQPGKIVFSGVGKTPQAIRLALEFGIKCFNVESIQELDTINDTARDLGLEAPISLRINPDVDAKTHPYISTGLKSNKFGISHDNAISAYQKARSLDNLRIVGIDCHIGSQIIEVSPFIDALKRVLSLVDELAQIGISLEHIDLGGGLGVDYQGEIPPSIGSFLNQIDSVLGDRPLDLVFEPGRSITANAGVLLTEVLVTKENAGKHFAIVDAAMNDLMRPALYDAWQKVEVIHRNNTPPPVTWDIVGPVCETGDFLAKQRKLSLAVGDLVVVRSAGAYGFAMASNYNSRPRSAEVMICNDKWHIIRERETVEELFKHERILPDT